MDTLNLLMVMIFATCAFIGGIVAPQIIMTESGLVKVDGVTSVACGSDSMGLTIGCNDLLMHDDVDHKDRLIPGDIYIFKSPYAKNETVVHRLVACLDDDCNQTIFKGDNNAVADPVVNRSDILYKVVRVEYR